MTGLHVVGALRAKRLEIAQHIHDTEKKLAKLRASAANIDAAIDLLTPDHPDAMPRRIYQKTRYFASNELPRLMLDALRKSSGPLTAGDLAASAIKANGLPSTTQEAVTGQVLKILAKLKRRGAVAKTGTTRNAQWALAAAL